MLRHNHIALAALLYLPHGVSEREQRIANECTARMSIVGWGRISLNAWKKEKVTPNESAVEQLLTATGADY